MQAAITSKKSQAPRAAWTSSAAGAGKLTGRHAFRWQSTETLTKACSMSSMFCGISAPFACLQAVLAQAAAAEARGSDEGSRGSSPLTRRPCRCPRTATAPTLVTRTYCRGFRFSCTGLTTSGKQVKRADEVEVVEPSHGGPLFRFGMKGLKFRGDGRRVEEVASCPEETQGSRSKPGSLVRRLCLQPLRQRRHRTAVAAARRVRHAHQSLSRLSSPRYLPDVQAALRKQRVAAKVEDRLSGKVQSQWSGNPELRLPGVCSLGCEGWEPWPKFYDPEPRFDGWTSLEWKDWVSSSCGSRWFCSWHSLPHRVRQKPSIQTRRLRCYNKKAEADMLAEWMVACLDLSDSPGGYGQNLLGSEDITHAELHGALHEVPLCIASEEGLKRFSLGIDRPLSPERAMSCWK